MAATITTSILVERAAERRVPRQLRQLTAHLDELAKQAPVAEAARVALQAASDLYTAGRSSALPRAVGSSVDDDPTVIIPTGRKLWLLPPAGGEHH